MFRVQVAMRDCVKHDEFCCVHMLDGVCVHPDFNDCMVCTYGLYVMTTVKEKNSVYICR